jgi:hypothetical protein
LRSHRLQHGGAFWLLFTIPLFPGYGMYSGYGWHGADDHLFHTVRKSKDQICYPVPRNACVWDHADKDVNQIHTAGISATAQKNILPGDGAVVHHCSGPDGPELLQVPVKLRNIPVVSFDTFLRLVVKLVLPINIKTKVYEPKRFNCRNRV